MKCRTWKYLLPDRAAGRLEGAELHALDEHILICPDCREELRRFQALFSSLKEEVHDAPSQTEWNNFLVHVRKGIDRKNTRPFASPVFLRLVLPAALSLMLIAGALLLFQNIKLSSSDVAIREGIRSVVSQLDSTQLAAMDIPMAVDPSLPDIISSAALETDASDSLDQHLADHLFAGLSETEIVKAGSEYALPNEASPFYESTDALHTIQDISLESGL
jgi:hypothetical protein